MVRPVKSKVSPPPGEGVLKPQYPSQELRTEAIEQSPEHQTRSVAVALKPKYPRQELRSEPNELPVGPKQHRTTRRFLGALVSVILTGALLHVLVIVVGNHALGEILSDSGGGQFLRGRLHFFFKAYPRMVFLEDRFQPIWGRKIEQYPADMSDPTQLYPTEDSNDTPSMERRFFPGHETDEDCVPMSDSQKASFRKWLPTPRRCFFIVVILTLHPSTLATCNNVHALGLGDRVYDDTLRFLSNAGSWRDAWRFKAKVAHPPGEKEIIDNVILKTIKVEHPLEERYFEFSRVDALAMEQLTSDPYVMNVHDFCGVSVVTERGEDSLGKVVQRLSPRAKVELAVKVALSIDALHNASFVHNDINADNIFIGTKNNPKLNDFNIAVLTMRNNRTNETCPFVGHFPNQQWKSPEEQFGPDGKAIGELNEKVDIYALGNLLFQLATNNKRPWRDLADGDGISLSAKQKDQVTRLKLEGKMPTVPEHILKLNDPYINLLLEAMKQCYRF